MKLTLILVLFCNFYSTQQTISAQTILDFENYKSRVLNFHPVVKKAKNAVMIGENEVLKTKGLLDPKFYSEINAKQFDDKNYYNLSNTGLKIPTYLGIDFKAGYEQNNGQFVSEEHKTPGSGLWYAGVEVPIGQGLFFDERRVTIQTANVFQKMAVNEQELMLNDLLLDAYSAYWLWYEEFQKLKIAEEGLNFAEERFRGVKQNAILGEVPDIDTVEAKIQLFNRRFEKTQAEFDYLNAKTFLNLYLWTENFIPLELEDSTIPQIEIQSDYNKTNLNLRITNSIGNELPLVLNSRYKLEQLEIEQKWKKEQLKPILTFSYNPLIQPVGNNLFGNYSPNNFKYGITANMPIFLRKERGALAQTRLKVENTNLDLAYKLNEIQQKEEFLRNDIFRLYEQLEIQRLQVIQAKKLRDSEQTRFEIGESSLFLVNSRELSYLQYKVKLVEIEAKMKISEAKWRWIFSELE